MDKLVFGEHVICSKCSGSGVRAMTKTEAQQRIRELSLAKRTHSAPPVLERKSCIVCDGYGYTKVPVQKASEGSAMHTQGEGR